MDDASEAGLGQASAAVQERGAALRPDAGPDLIPDVGAQTMQVEVVELERFVVLERQVVKLEPHAEPVAQEEPRGVGEEGDKVGESDDAPGRVRLRQRHADEAGWNLGRGRPRPHRLRRFAHAAGVAEEILPGDRPADGRSGRGDRRFRGAAVTVGSALERVGLAVADALRLSGHLEVPRAERLERMAGHERLAREPAGEVVLELGDQHRGRDRGVVAQAPPGVGHEEAASRRQQRLQEREPVLAPDVAVSSPGASRRDDIERRRRRRARKHAVVHADHAHHAGGNDPACPQARDGHPVGQPRRLARGPVRTLAEHVQHHLERHRSPGVRRFVLEFPDEGANRGGFLRQLAGERPARGSIHAARPLRSVGEKVPDHVTKHRTPSRRRAPAAEPVTESEYPLAVRDEAAQQLAVHLPEVEPARRAPAGHEPRDRLGGIGHRVTQQKPAQALPPGVIGGLGQVFLAPVRLVHPPADAGFPHPVPDRGDVRAADPEPDPDRRRRERCQHRLRPVPRRRQRQEVEKCVQRARLRRPRPDDIARDPPRRREDGLDDWSVGLQVRRQHQGVGRFEIRMRVEDGEQAVVQHLRLAYRGVADVNLNRIVPRRSPRRDRSADGRFVVPGGLAREPEIEDVAVDRGQGAGARGLFEALLPIRIRHLHQGVDHVATRPPPRREELVALREVAGAGVLAFGPVVDLAPRMDVAPVLAARVEHEEVNLDSLRRLAEQLQVRGRKRRHREEASAPRPAVRP